MTNKIFKPFMQECQLSNCGFNHTPSDEFVRSQWQSRNKNVFYVLYRWANAIFFIGAIIDSIVSSQPGGFYFIYLTNWGMMLCTGTQLLGAILVSLWYFHPSYSDKVNGSNEMPVAFKVYWGLHNTTLVLSIVITITFWSLLYDGTQSDATNILTHACNSVFMFLDMLIVAYPLRLMHVIQPVFMGFIYVVFNVIYYAAGGLDPFGRHYIYIVLDWAKPGEAIVVVVLTLVGLFVVHFVLFFIYKIRLSIYNSCCTKKNKHDLPTSAGLSRDANGSCVIKSETRISMVLGNTNEGFEKGSIDKF